MNHLRPTVLFISHFWVINPKSLCEASKTKNLPSSTAEGNKSWYIAILSD